MRNKRLPAEFVVPAKPVKASKPPSGADWVHEIKHDGYRLMREAAHGAILYAFDLIEHDGEDLRNRAFLDRKAALARLLCKYRGGRPAQ